MNNYQLLQRNLQDLKLTQMSLKIDEYITKINEEFEGDVYFPQIDEKEWNIVETEKGLTNEQNPFDYEYVTYIRK